MAEHNRDRDQQQQHPTDVIKSMLPRKGPSTSQVLAVATLFPVGGVLLCLAGLTLAGTLVGLAVMTPLFVIFSPVLVPAALTFALAVTGFLTSGAFGITALSSLSWIVNYLPQRRRTLPEHLEHETRSMQDTADHPSMVEHHRDRDQQQPTDVIKSMLPYKGPSTSKVMAVTTLVPVGSVLLCLAALTLAGTLVGLAVMTPLFVIFSPVLVPAALTFAVAVTGFFTSGAFGITALSSLSWIINYMRQMRGTLPELLEHAKRCMQDTASHVGQNTKEIGQRAQEAVRT